MPRSIVIVGTLDTKGDQIEYLKEVVAGLGHPTCVVDVGVMGEASFEADIGRDKVAGACGMSIEEVIAIDDPNVSMIKMGAGAVEVLKELVSQDRVNGVMALGGSMGTSVALAVMKTLPLGLPKLIVSTVAYSAAITPELVTGSDLMMLPWVAGLWGLNSLSKRALETAAGAVSGAARLFDRKGVSTKKIVGVTSLGGSVIRYMDRLKPALEERGYEAAVFHTTGMSGRIFEKSIRDGLFRASLDLSVGVELINQVTGGVCTAGERRLEAAGAMGIPQIVSTGVIEAFHWGKDRPLPDKYRDRPRNPYNELLLIVSSSVEEMAGVGELMAQKLNLSRGPAAVVIPMKGIGKLPAADKAQKPSEFREARVKFRKALAETGPKGLVAFRDALIGRIKPEVNVITLDASFNDPVYAETVLGLFDEMTG